MKKVLVILLVLALSASYQVVRAHPTSTETVVYDAFILKFNKALKEYEQFVSPVVKLRTPPFIAPTIHEKDSGAVHFSFKYNDPSFHVFGDFDKDSTIILNASISFGQENECVSIEKHFLRNSLLISVGEEGYDPSKPNPNYTPETGHIINNYRLIPASSETNGGIDLFLNVPISDLEIPQHMSLDEIVELSEDMKSLLEISVKINTVTTVVLQSGEYIVGQHIPAGEYSASTVAISVNLTTRRDGKLRINEVLSPANPIGRMVLQVGDEIEISGGAVNFKLLQ